MIYINKLMFDFIKHYKGVLDSSMFYGLPINNMNHFGYTAGGTVVVQNISSCRPLDSFNFSTKCLLQYTNILLRQYHFISGEINMFCTNHQEN